MMLPKISGSEVWRARKNDPRTNFIPVIALTGLSQTNQEKLEHDGAADFVKKSDDLSFRRDATTVLNGKNWEIDFLTAVRR